MPIEAKLRAITLQATPDGQSCQGGSVTYDVTLPTGEVQQHQLDVSAWINQHIDVIAGPFAATVALLQERYSS